MGIKGLFNFLKEKTPTAYQQVNIKKWRGKQLLEKVDKKKFVGRKFKVENLCFNKYHEDETIIDLGV